MNKFYCDCCKAEVMQARLKTFHVAPRGNQTCILDAEFCPTCFSLIVSLLKQVSRSKHILMETSKRAAVEVLGESSSTSVT